MNHTMMFVDDSLDERILIRRQINKRFAGLSLIEANSGQAAIARLTLLATADLPKMILLDLKMPGVDGFQVLKWVRDNNHTRHVPVVMFSTSDDKQDIAMCYELGANSYVVKDLRHKNLDVLFIYWGKINKHLIGPVQPDAGDTLDGV